MLKGSATTLTHWAGERRTERSAWSHQLAAMAAQGPAAAHTPFRKENPTNRYETSGFAIKGRLIAPLPFMLFEKPFHKIPEPRINNSRMGEEGDGSGILGFGKPHDGQGGRQNRRSTIAAPAAPWGAQLSPLPIHSINSFPSGRLLAGLQTGHRESVVSIIHSTLCVQQSHSGFYKILAFSRDII